MIKAKEMKKVVAIACVGVIGASSLAMGGGIANAEEKTVPAHINVPVTAIDFSVTEKINMTGSENSTALTVDSLEVTNNSDVGVLKIDSVQATAAGGWQIVADSTDFTKLNANAKQVSMKADNTFDMQGGAYTAAGTVDPGQTDTTTFSGKTGMVTTAVNDEKVADVVVTVSYK